MMPGTDIEALLVDEMRGMRTEFREMSKEWGAMASKLESLAETQQELRGMATRLTTIETEQRVTKEWVDNARVNNRWLIGMTVASFVSVAIMLFNVWQHH